MSGPLRIGLIGLGKIGRVHWKNLNDLPSARVVAIAEVAPLQTEDLPPEVALSQDWRQMLANPEVDAVVISLPHSLHAECAKAALLAGKHVFLEKPLATNLADARDLVACAGETGRILMANMTHRFYPPLCKARALLHEGAIGDVISVRDYYMEIIDRKDFPAWFFDPVMAGGGVAMTDSIHLIDRVSWLLKEPLHFIGGSSRRLMPETNVEDCAEILCATPSGIPVTIGSFFFIGPKIWDDGLTVFGTKGKMMIQAWSHIEWCTYGGEVQREDGYVGVALADRPQCGHRAAMSEFLEAIRTGREPEATAASVLNAQEIIEKFYETTEGGLPSARTV